MVFEDKCFNNYINEKISQIALDMVIDRVIFKNGQIMLFPSFTNVL